MSRVLRRAVDVRAVVRGRATSPTIMRELYVRGFEKLKDGGLDRDITALDSVSQVASGVLDNDVSRWLGGMGALSTSRYREGFKHYYSPVGYIVEINDPERVLGNYAGDGNTGTLQKPKLGATGKSATHYAALIEAIRAAFATNDATAAAWTVHAGIPGQNPTTDTDAMQGRIEAFLKDPIEANVRAAAVVLLTATARTVQQAYYMDTGKPGVPLPDTTILPLELGPGLNPVGLTEMENIIMAAPEQRYEYGSSSEARYTESKLSATIGDVKAAYFTADEGSYGAVALSWATGKGWLAKRRAIAVAALLDLRAAGAAAATLMQLNDGKLTEVDLTDEDLNPLPTTVAEQQPVRAGLEQLLAMGFPADQANNALDASGGDVEQAIGFLFS